MLKQKVPDREKVISNRRGARSDKVMELCMEVILPDLQSMQYGGCIGLYLH